MANTPIAPHGSTTDDTPTRRGRRNSTSDLDQAGRRSPSSFIREFERLDPRQLNAPRPAGNPPTFPEQSGANINSSSQNASTSSTVSSSTPPLLPSSNLPPDTVQQLQTLLQSLRVSNPQLFASLVASSDHSSSSTSIVPPSTPANRHPPQTLFTAPTMDRTTRGLPNAALGAAREEATRPSQLGPLPPRNPVDAPVSFPDPTVLHPPSSSTLPVAPATSAPSLQPSSANPMAANLPSSVPSLPSLPAGVSYRFKPNPPPSFGGSTDVQQINDWGSKVQDFLVLSGAIPDTPIAVRIAASFLTGDAYSHYKQETLARPDIFPTFANLLDSLRNHFLPTNWRKKLYDKWERVKQYPNESIKSLANRLVDIRNNMPVAIPEEFAVQRLLNAMDPSLRSLVEPLITSGNSLVDVVATAERYESARPQRASPSSASPSPPSASSSNSSRQPHDTRSSNSSSRSPAEPSKSSNSSAPPAPSPYKLSEDLKTKLSQQERCFKCAGKGNGSKGCTVTPRKLPAELARIVNANVVAALSSFSAEPLSSDDEYPKLVRPSLSPHPATATAPVAASDPPDSSTSHRLRIKVRLGSRASVTGTIDTGSDLDMITASAVKRHGFDVIRLETPREFVTVDGSLSSYQSFVSVLIRIRNIRTYRVFYITDSLPTPILLGNSFLADYRAQIDFSTTPPSLSFSPHPFDHSPLSSPDLSGSDMEISDDDVPLVAAVTPSDAEERRRRLFQSYSSLITDSPPNTLPPLRAVNHTIPLRDPSLRIRPRVYQPPLKARDAYFAKLKTQRENGRWIRLNHLVDSAIPSHAFLKPSGEIRFTLDARQRDANLVRDHYPIPSQGPILSAAQSSTHLTVLDVSDAYEWVRIVPEHVERSTFMTIDGAYQSLVMQQGDSNAPSTWSRLMDHVLGDLRDQGVHVYFDDITICTTGTADDHEKVVCLVLTHLQDQELYLKPRKCHFFVDRAKILGRIISRNGIEMDPSKLDAFLSFSPPRSRKELQQLLGLFQWIAPHLYNATGASSPLHRLAGSRGAFDWTAEHDLSLDAMKSLVRSAFPLHPLDPSPSADPIHLVCDASIDGGAAWLGQGPTWEDARPIGFFSHKHTSAERNYPVHEQEVLAAVGALRHFQLVLLGRPFAIYTDSQFFSRFFTSPTDPSPRQARWLEYFSRFDFSIRHIPGIQNRIADALSRLPTTLSMVPLSPPSSLDDPELPPLDDLVPLPSRPLVAALTRATNSSRSFRHFAYLNPDPGPPRQIPTSTSPSDILPPTPRVSRPPPPVPPRPVQLMDTIPPPRTPHDLLNSAAPPLVDPLGPTATSLPSFPVAQPSPVLSTDTLTPSDSSFLQAVRQAYPSDSLFRQILPHPDRYPAFQLHDDLLYYSPFETTRQGVRIPSSGPRLCIPAGRLQERSLRDYAISFQHHRLGHLGIRATTNATRSAFYWPSLVADIESFVPSCHTCVVSKSSTTAPSGFAHPLPVPTHVWRDIALDFVGPLPPSVDYDKHPVDFLLVVTCRFSGAVHLYPLQQTATASDIALLFYRCHYRYHGLPTTIVSDRDTRWTSSFWSALHSLLGTQLRLSTAFHPQTDGQTERANKTVGQMLRALCGNSPSTWPRHLVALEFAMNSAINSSTGFSPFTLSNGYQPFSIPALFSTFSSSPDASAFVDSLLLSQAAAHDSLIAARTRQSVYSNSRRSSPPAFKVDNYAYFDARNLSFPPSFSGKFRPRFIGPYRIIRALPNNVYEVAFPPAFKIHPIVNGSLLRQFIPNDDRLFPRRSFLDDSPVPVSDDQYEIEAILKHKWIGAERFFLIKFLGRPEAEAQWTAEDEMDAPDFIAAYERLRPGSRKPPGQKQRQSVRKPQPTSFNPPSPRRNPAPAPRRRPRHPVPIF